MPTDARKRSLQNRIVISPAFRMVVHKFKELFVKRRNPIAIKVTPTSQSIKVNSDPVLARSFAGVIVEHEA